MDLWGKSSSSEHGRHMPTWRREEQQFKVILVKIESWHRAIQPAGAKLKTQRIMGVNGSHTQDNERLCTKRTQEGESLIGSGLATNILGRFWRLRMRHRPQE